ncbi:DUF1932 domain-containing protein [Spirillospora sp. NBC_00431]
MPKALTMAILHPGQMGAVLGSQARRAGIDVVWLGEGRSRATRERASAAGLRDLGDMNELAEQSDLIVAVCPPDAAEEVAAAVVKSGFSGIYVEANPIRPQRSRRIAEMLAETGCTVLDGCVIGPAELGAGGLRVYLSGEAGAAALVSATFGEMKLTVSSLGEEVGAASALKLAYALSQKAGRSLAAVSYALAERYAVGGELRAEAESLRGNPLREPDYLPIAASRGWRWAAEMEEIHETLTDADLPDGLPLAAAEVFACWNGFKDRDDVDLTSVLGSLGHDAGR